MTWLAVAAGGAAGATLRYLLNQLWAGSGYPVATQVANVTGSLLIGLAFAWLIPRYGSAHPVYQLIVVGVLGGFTTYSTFSLDAWRMLEVGRPGLFLGYVGSTLLLCLAAVAVGLALGRRVL